MALEPFGFGPCLVLLTAPASECQPTGVRCCIHGSNISLASYITYIGSSQKVRGLPSSSRCGGKIRAVKTWSLIYVYPFNAWPSARGAGRPGIDRRLGVRFCCKPPAIYYYLPYFPFPQKSSHFREVHSLRSKRLLNVHPRNLEIEVHRPTDTRFGLL